MCRVPVYLTRGMIRARIKLVKQSVFLLSDQIEKIERAHSIISELVVNIAHLSHVGLRPSDPKICKILDRIESKEDLVTTIVDQFSKLKFDVQSAQMLAFVTFLKLPCK